MLQRRAQVGKPRVLVLADQSHAPGKRVAAAPGYPGLDQRVKDHALGLPQPGHHRYRERGEHHSAIPGPNTPRDLTPEGVLGFMGDLDPLLPGLLAEPATAALPGGGSLAF